MMTIPPTYTEINETGCCAIAAVEGWDRTVVHFEDKRFIRMLTRSVLHMPLNMASVMTALDMAAEGAGAQMPPTEAMCLTRDLSPWRSEQLYAVSRPVEGVENVTLTGDFAARAFEGPYRKAGEWAAGVRAYAEELGRPVTDVYVLYATCPSCAKHYGRNDVIVLARLSG